MAYEPAPAYGQPAKTSTMAIISLIGGIAGFTVLPVIGSIVGAVTGHMAKKEIRNSGGSIGGDGLATVGLVLSYIGIGLTVLGICAGVAWLLFSLGLLGFLATQSSSLAPVWALL